MNDDLTDWAEILHAIADGKQIQFRASEIGAWNDIPAENVLSSITRGMWQVKHFRVKPDVIRIGALEVPRPVTERLADKTPVYTPCITGAPNLVIETEYDIGHPAHVMWFRRGLLHLTREAAHAHAKALLAFTDSGEES